MLFISEGLQDDKFIAERTEGYEKIKEIVKDYTPERVAEICHIDADDLRKQRSCMQKQTRLRSFTALV